MSMTRCEEMSKEIRDKYIMPGDHAKSNYFAAISELVRLRDAEPENKAFYQKEIDGIYSLVRDEILTSQAKPLSPVKFGTSGWRGITALLRRIWTLSSTTTSSTAWEGCGVGR